MARRLGAERNLLLIDDPQSESTIGFFYKQPTTDQITQYNNELVKRKHNKVKMQQGEVRLKYGLEILLGFRDGDFEVPEMGLGKGKDKDKKDKEKLPEWKPISSEKGADNYYAGWRAVIKANAADLVMVLGKTIFEGAESGGIDIGGK